MKYKLSETKSGKSYVYVGIEGQCSGELQKFADMGFIPGDFIEVTNNSGMGPITVVVKGSKLALGQGVARRITVRDYNQSKRKLTVALAGNPNTGKSTIFNNLTGSRQHVGNYPGVTVEKREGIAGYKGYEMTFVDLPGTYSLSAYSQDEVVTRDFIIHEKPDVIVHIVDASNLERNLYLYTQLLELKAPVVLAMNMSDIVEKKGHSIDYKKLSGYLGSPIVQTVGSKNKGMSDLLDSVIGLYEGNINSEKIKIDYGEEFLQEYNKIIQVMGEEDDLIKDFPIEWIAIKLIEDDPSVKKLIGKLSNGEQILSQVEKGRHHITQHFEDGPEVLIADRRYGFISGACTLAMLATVEERHDLSDRIDVFILSRFFGLPIFALVMYGIFKFTFTFSEPVVGFFEKIFGWIGGVAMHHIPDGLLQSFVVDGIIGGVGGVLGFFPLVLFMFFAIAFFEDSGYMARAAFVMDKLMSKFGLHGKSFLPMMISTNGCAVPGILATRTLDSNKDRMITMMVTPFMICGAKLPIFALFIGAFFPSDQGANLMFIMYALSIALAFSSAWVLKKFVFKGEAAHFVMELPPYRIPTLKGLLLKMWERGWQYIKKAGTIILLISIIMWAGFTFPEINKKEGVDENIVAMQQMESSYVGQIGKFVEPAVRPIGLDWRAGVALIAGVAAKEVVVSTLGTIYSLGEVDVDEADSLKDALRKDPAWSPIKAIAFLMFCLIYMPCIVATSVFYKESGSSLKWTVFLISWTTIMAWLAAFIVFQGGMLLRLGG